MIKAERSMLRIPINMINGATPCANTEELETSINQVGLLEPIGVCRNGSEFDLVFGNRRLQACRKIGMKTVFAILFSPRDDATLIRLSENFQQMPYRWESQALLIEKHAKGKPGAFCKKMGFSAKRTERICRFLALEPQRRELIVENKVKSEVFDAIAKMSAEEQYEVLSRLARCEAAPEKAQNPSPVLTPRSYTEYKKKIKCDGGNAFTCTHTWQIARPPQMFALTAMHDSRIFINTIMDITSKMRTFGYGELITQTENEITIKLPSAQTRKNA